MLARAPAGARLSALYGFAREFTAAAPEPSTSGRSFWQEVQISDLPDTTPDLEVLRRHNSSYPFYKQQVVVGKVVGVERDHVAVYSGHKTLTKFAKKELHLSQLVRSRNASQRDGPKDFRVGDVLHLMLDELETPFGDVGLKVVKLDNPAERLQAVFAEIQAHFARGEPVMGRILNPVNKGFAVGIAGVAAFMPYSLCSLLTASKVGVLQPFLIDACDRVRMSIVVADPTQIAEREQRQRRLLKRPQQPSTSAEEGFQGPYTDRKALHRSQVQALAERAAQWQAEARTAGGEPLPFPNALKIAGEICSQRQFYLQRLNLEYLIRNIEAELPAARYEDFLGTLRGWGIDTRLKRLHRTEPAPAANERLHLL